MIFSSKKLPNYEILNNPKNSCKKVLCKFGATCLKKLDLLTHVGGIYAHEIEGHSELVCACRFNCSKQIDHPGRVESYEWLVKKLQDRPHSYMLWSGTESKFIDRIRDTFEQLVANH